jgi:hypothetical protein
LPATSGSIKPFLLLSLGRFYCATIVQTPSIPQKMRDSHNETKVFITDLH